VAATRCGHFFGIFQKQVKYLIPAKTMLKKNERVHFMCDDHPWMGIQQGPDQTMAGSWITDENAIRSDISKKFGIPTALQQRRCVKAGQSDFSSE
jgi:hypothetical protein